MFGHFWYAPAPEQSSLTIALSAITRLSSRLSALARGNAGLSAAGTLQNKGIVSARYFAALKAATKIKTSVAGLLGGFAIPIALSANAALMVKAALRIGSSIAPIPGRTIAVARRQLITLSNSVRTLIAR